MGAYAKYLDARIKAWKELKQDPVRVQTESNRRSDGLGAGCEWCCAEPNLCTELTGSQGTAAEASAGGEGSLARGQAGAASADGAD
jgi:hypothetical protein